MLPLLQADTTSLPFVPARLDDIALLTVFIAPNWLPTNDEPNGTGWCLRSYPSLDELVDLAQPSEPLMWEIPLRPTLVSNDYPCWDDLSSLLTHDEIASLDESQQAELGNRDGTKLGGWPTQVARGGLMQLSPWQSGEEIQMLVAARLHDPRGEHGVRPAWSFPPR